MTLLFSGFTLIAVALAVIMSAMVRLLQAMQLRQRVDAQMTGVRELAELSGINDPRDLQDVFGPPGMDRTWSQVTMAMIGDRKRLGGYLMTDARLHWGCVLIALAAFVTGHWVVQVLLLSAVLAQIGAWLSALQLPK